MTDFQNLFKNVQSVYIKLRQMVKVKNGYDIHDNKNTLVIKVSVAVMELYRNRYGL